MTAPTRTRGFDVARLRRDFPILQTTVQDRPLVYLDNAATSQKPRAVVEAEAEFALHHNANVHRGVHLLSQRATQAYDQVRADLAHFLGAADPGEIIITAGTTAGL